MRDADGTFREAEGEIREHRERREAPGLARVPDFTPLSRFRKRLPKEAQARALGETVRRLGPPASGAASVAVDATGLTPGAVSPFFIQRRRNRGGVWRR